ncbi:hypothetical protein [Saccharothrix sp. Mg75]|uniref:hypothetical protein n=1 Tax=Saccharothrix sp. Mg75 TaxID=3445357 RepID=UPI003EEDC71C
MTTLRNSADPPARQHRSTPPNATQQVHELVPQLRVYLPWPRAPIANATLPTRLRRQQVDP